MMIILLKLSRNIRLSSVRIGIELSLLRLLDELEFIGLGWIVSAKNGYSPKSSERGALCLKYW